MKKIFFLNILLINPLFSSQQKSGFNTNNEHPNTQLHKTLKTIEELNSSIIPDPKKENSSDLKRKAAITQIKRLAQTTPLNIGIYVQGLEQHDDPNLKCYCDHIVLPKELTKDQDITCTKLKHNVTGIKDEIARVRNENPLTKIPIKTLEKKKKKHLKLSEGFGAIALSAILYFAWKKNYFNC